MHYYTLKTVAGELGIMVANGSGQLHAPLPREGCPSCDEARCANHCDGSQGADENNTETEEDAHERATYNAALDMLESLVLAHACAGINVESADYLTGVNTALEAFANNQ
jgi:hypothetical protein